MSVISDKATDLYSTVQCEVKGPCVQVIVETPVISSGRSKIHNIYLSYKHTQFKSYHVKYTDYPDRVFASILVFFLPETYFLDSLNCKTYTDTNFYTKISVPFSQEMK